MAQEIDCRLTAFGPKADVESFYAQLFTQGFDPDRNLKVSFCKTFFAMPDELDTIASMQQWQLENWGAIDGDSFVIAVSLTNAPKNTATVEIDFMAVDYAPTAAVQTLRTLFPTIEFTLTHDSPEKE